MAVTPAAPPSLVDARAERALLGVLMREPRRFADARIRRALFAMPPHVKVFDALRAAHERGELGGDVSTASAVVEAVPFLDAPRLFVVEAWEDADDVIAEAVIGHLVRLGKRRVTKQLALGLAAVADTPSPGEDRETLATIGARVSALADPPAEDSPFAVADTILPRRVAWLWDRRIPFGKVTLVEGDPGLGKSTLTLDVAARVTRGAPQEGDTTAWDPGGVVLVGAEDGLDDTLRPRLEAAGADLHRVAAFKLDRLPILPTELGTVRAAMRAVDAVLVILDPLAALLASSVDSYRDQDVRRVLAALAGLADDTGAAVVIVRHLTKQAGPKALYRGGGSIGIAGAARSVLLVAADPDENTEQRVLAPVKSNLCAPAAPLRFSLEPLGDAVRVTWHGESTRTADDLVKAPGADEDDRSASIGEAVAVLQTLLGVHGAVAADTAERERRRLGISEYAWRRARHRLLLETSKEGFSGGWVLRSPLNGRGQ
jgi:hypothetical protein